MATNNRRTLNVEALEDRSLMATALSAALDQGVLTITGTERSDRILVRLMKDRITISGTKESFAALEVKKLVVDGGAGNDIIDLGLSGKLAVSVPSIMRGGSGNDILRGGAGDDYLCGGDGNDFLAGGSGRDLLDSLAGGKDVRFGLTAGDIWVGNNGKIESWTGKRWNTEGMAMGTRPASLEAGSVVYLESNHTLCRLTLVSGETVAKKDIITDVPPSGPVDWAGEHTPDYVLQPGLWSWSGWVQIGSDWNQFTHIFMGNDGWIYAKRSDGALLKNLSNSDGTWSGWIQIGSDWNQFTHIFMGKDGWIYAKRSDGELFKNFSYANGTWAGWVHIGSDWNQFTHIFMGNDGWIYAKRSDGVLLKNFSNGDGTWRGWVHIGSDWNQFTHIFMGNDGWIYAKRSDGALFKNFSYGDGTWKGWVQIGSDWNQFTHIFMGNDGWIYTKRSDGLLLRNLSVLPDGNNNLYLRNADGSLYLVAEKVKSFGYVWGTLYVLHNNGMLRELTASGWIDLGADVFSRYLPNFSSGARNVTASFSNGQLTITGTEKSDFIVVRKSNGRIFIDGLSASFDSSQVKSIVLNARSGDDFVSLKAADFDGSATIQGGAGDDYLCGSKGNDTIYGGTGADRLYGEAGDDTLVALDSVCDDYLQGGIGRDSIWVDDYYDGNWRDFVEDDRSPVDSGNFIHAIVRFSNPGADLTLDGDRIADPTTTAGTRYARFANNRLFADGGPTLTDVRQGSLGDCWLRAGLSAIAKTNPSSIRQMVVDFGDGTYGVQLGRSFYRVDNDLPVANGSNPAFAALGRDNSMWVAIVEKAYAHYRSGGNSYFSLIGGWSVEVNRACGAITTGNFTLTRYGSAANLGTAIHALWSRNEAVTIGFAGGSIAAGAPLINGHMYTVTRVIRDTTGAVTQIELHNPWGIDGASNDANPNDGLVVVTPQQLFGSTGRLNWGRV